MLSYCSKELFPYRSDKTHARYCRLKDVLGTVEDVEIDIPKVWQYLAEILSPMLQSKETMPTRFLHAAFELLKHNPKVGDVIAYVLNDAAKRLVSTLYSAVQLYECIYMS